MIDDIKKAIEKNLPATMSKEIQDYLAKADEALEANKQWGITNKRQVEELEKLRALKLDAQVVETGKADLEAARTKFEVEKIQYKLDVEKSKYSDVRNLMDTVFQNKHMTFHTAGHVTQPDYTTRPFDSTTTVVEE